MSTSYYWHEEGHEPLLVGRASAGWKFLFRAHPQEGITTPVDWPCRMLNNVGTLRDEYGTTIPPANLIKKARERLIQKSHFIHWGDQLITDDDGHEMGPE